MPPPPLPQQQPPVQQPVQQPKRLEPRERVEPPWIGVLHLFSGPSGEPDDFGAVLKEMLKHKGTRQRLRVRDVDYINCRCGDGDLASCCAAELRRLGYNCDNLLRDEVFRDLLAECEQGLYRIIIAGIPCNTYCVARFNGKGARALRDRDHPWGLPGLTPEETEQLNIGNELTRRSLLLCAAVWKSGGEVLIENPPDYAAPGLWCTDRRTGEHQFRHMFEEQQRHCPLWQMPWMRAFEEATCSQKLDFAQCQFGSDFQKYTTLLVTPEWRRVAAKCFDQLDGAACRCAQPHEQRATGRGLDGGYLSRHAAAYPMQMKALLARAVVMLLEPTTAEHARVWECALGISGYRLPAELEDVDGSARAEALRRFDMQIHMPIDEHGKCQGKQVSMMSFVGRKRTYSKLV